MRDDYEHCNICPYIKNKPCQENLIRDCFEFINQQQAEIARLNGNLLTISNACMQRRNEAIKEFCGEIETKAFNLESPFESNEDKIIKVVALEDINNLLAERVGGENDTN